MPGCVRLDRTAGPRAATAALIEQDHSVSLGIEKPTHRRATPAARPAMKDKRGDTVRIAALFDIDTVPITHIQHPLIEGINRRI